MGRHVFHISGIKTPKTKSKLLHGIKELGGEYIGGSVYNEAITHLIVTHAMASEKFVSACAQGKWIVTPAYVWESVKKGVWLPEGPFELHMAPQAPGLSNPVCVWRERVALGVLAGAFEGWAVLLMIEEPGCRDMFTRILTAGKAIVYSSRPPSQAALTHVLTKKKHEKCFCPAPCYTLHHIAQHLFGKLCDGVGVPWTDAGPAEDGQNSAVSSELETEVRDTQLETEVRDTETEVRDTETEVRDTETEVRDTQLETEVRDTETEVRDTETEVRDTETEVRDTETEVRDTETEVRDTQLETEVRDSETEVRDTEIETEVRDSETEVRDTETEVRDTETEVRDSETEVRDTETEVRDTELDTEVRDTETEVRDTETEVRDTETEVRDTETEVRDSETEVRDTETETEVRDTETETEVRDTEMEAEVRDSETEVRDTQLETEVRDAQLETDTTDSELDTETTHSEQKQGSQTETRESEVEAGPRESETTDSEQRTQTRDSEVEAGPRESELELELRDCILKAEERKRLVFPEFLSYQAPGPGSQTRTAAATFLTLKSLVECGCFIQALEDVQGCLHPGVLPPVPHMAALLLHALQGKATSSFLVSFWPVLHRLLRYNPSWSSPATTSYFSQLLQCPECKTGLWPLLDTSIRYCMSSEDPSCHSLPSPASPELLRFHGNLHKFVLKLFQWELHSANSGGPTGARSSVLYSSFWSVWERLTLGSRPVCQLAQLLVQATAWELSISQEAGPAERGRRQDLALVLQELLSAVVEYWCQTHRRRNRAAVEQGVADLAEHLAVLCRDLPPHVLTVLVPMVTSARLRMATADAVFRSLCARSGVFMGAEPLSLRKILTSYLPALGRLAAGRPGAFSAPQVDSRAGAEPPAPPSRTPPQGSGPRSGMPSAQMNGTNPGKENRGLNKVNAVGETLLHIACRRNDVEKLLQILEDPGTDVNVEDHAGWTPLHEACNHGSAGCVAALLSHAPSLRVIGQVDGVSPVHDALLNGHLDIAKMLLEHAGSSLLQQRDRDGRTATDLVATATQRAELRASAAAGDGALESEEEVRDAASLEAGSCLLTCLLVCYPRERGVPPLCWGPAPDEGHAPDGHSPSLGARLAAALGGGDLRALTAGWADPRMVRAAEDVEAGLRLGAGPGTGGAPRVSRAVRSSRGGHTCFLLSILPHEYASP